MPMCSLTSHHTETTPIGRKAAWLVAISTLGRELKFGDVDGEDLGDNWGSVRGGSRVATG
jgi:hypothetical protein